MITRYLFTTLSLLVSALVMAQSEACDSSYVIFEQNFDHYIDSNLVYTLELAQNDFDNVSARTSGEIRGLSTAWPQENRVVNGALKAQYLKNDASGRSGGFLFDSSFEGVEEAVLEYKIKFDSNFVWATGGKLPGLGGAINQNQSMPAGCTQNTDVIENGFSCRLMWRSNRAHTQPPYLIVYDYLPNRTTNCGGNKVFIRDIKKETWYTVKQYIKLNTPGVNNGILQMYVDDQLLLEENDILYRIDGKDDLKINALVMHTYRGGQRTDTVWHSPTTDYIYFDDFKIWTNCALPLSENQVPSVSFKTPSGDTTVTEGYALFMEALAVDNDGMVDNVQLFINGEAKRMEKVAPYEWGHANSPDPDELNNLPVGQHEIKVVVTDNRGASNEAAFTLTVDQSSSLEDGKQLVTKSPSIFPVPFSDDLNIDLTQVNLRSIHLYNTRGELLRSFDNIQQRSSLQIATSEWADGIYFIKMSNVYNEVIFKKVLKQ